MHQAVRRHDASALTAALKQLPGCLHNGIGIPFCLQRVTSIMQTDASSLCVLVRRHFEAVCISCALAGKLERADLEHGAVPAVAEGIAQLHVEAKQRLWCDGRRRAWW